MSAFSALGKPSDVSDYCYPHPVDELLATHVETSNFKFCVQNSIYTPTSVILALLPSQYLVVKGTYKVKVLRGICLVNNAHEIPVGKEFPIVTSTYESLPTLAVPDGAEVPSENTQHHEQAFPKFPTVLEVSNWAIGVEDLGAYSPSLADVYFKFHDGYTFEVVLETKDSCPIYFDKHTLRILNSASRAMETVVVFGVPTSGKKTFSRALVNNIVLSRKRAVAYLDLDPSSIDSDNPGCLSLRVIRTPFFGEFSFLLSDNKDDTHRYYGFPSFSEKPSYYMQLCMELLAHYREHLEPKGIPLVVKYPCWVKGHGKDLLVEFSRALNPRRMVYMTHNDALSLDDFEPDAFEETDHPDADVLAGFQQRDYWIVRGVRRARAFTKNELLFRNKLLYFHRNSNGGFSFTEPLLFSPPSKLSFDHISAVSVLSLDSDESLTRTAVFRLVEATIMGIFVTKAVPTQPKNLYISGSRFPSLGCKYLGLCMVHSVNAAEGAFYVYLGNEEYLSEQIQQAKSEGESVVLARGEGQIPLVEFTNGMAGREGSLPYVSFDRRQKLGGIWKVRRNIGRKNQGGGA